MAENNVDPINSIDNNDNTSSNNNKAKNENTNTENDKFNNDSVEEVLENTKVNGSEEEQQNAASKENVIDATAIKASENALLRDTVSAFLDNLQSVHEITCGSPFEFKLVLPKNQDLYIEYTFGDEAADRIISYDKENGKFIINPQSDFEDGTYNLKIKILPLNIEKKIGFKILPDGCHKIKEFEKYLSGLEKQYQFTAGDTAFINITHQFLEETEHIFSSENSMIIISKVNGGIKLNIPEDMNTCETTIELSLNDIGKIFEFDISVKELVQEKHSDSKLLEEDSRDTRIDDENINAAEDNEKPTSQSDVTEEDTCRGPEPSKKPEEPEPSPDELNETEFVKTMSGREIGIDLGTTNSVVSYYKDGKLQTLKIAGSEIVPSAIFFESKDKIVYGSKALKKGVNYPNSLVRLFKRKLKDKLDKFRVEFSDTENSDGPQAPQETYYIIDSNVLINDSTVLKRLLDESTNKIIIPMKVIEELDRKKMDKSLPAAESFSVREALRIIDESSLKPEDPDLSLLSEGYDRKVADNQILAVALKYKNSGKCVMLTNDRTLKIKSRKEGLIVLSNEELEMEESQKEMKTLDKLNISGEYASALFLRYLKNEATKQIGYVSRVVITVPANFSPVEIEATKKAGEKAGFDEVMIYKEPTAAAVAYGLEENENKKILVYDFGGGTFDVSIIEVERAKTEKDFNNFKVIATGGNASLGGEDFTQGLIEFIYEKIFDDFDIDMSGLDKSYLTKQEYQDNKNIIVREAEKAKQELSSSEEAEINITNFNNKKGSQIAITVKIRRSEFEDIIRDNVKKTLDELSKVISDSGLKANDIDIIVLAGGTSMIPMIRDRVKKFFGKEPNSEKNTATVISQGASIVANVMFSSDKSIAEKIEIFENTVYDFGIGLKGHKFDPIILNGAELPVKAEKEYQLVNDNQSELEVELFRRRSGSKAERTVDLDEPCFEKIRIMLPPDLKKSETKVIVTFELSKEDILAADVRITDLPGNPIESSSLNIKRCSRA